SRAHPAEANRAIAEASLARVSEAQELGDFDTVKRLADVAVAASRKAKDTALAKRALELGKTVSAVKQQFDAWQKAKGVLAKSPDDPAANLAVGRYLCQVRGDWESG